MITQPNTNNNLTAIQPGVGPMTSIVSPIPYSYTTKPLK